METRNEVPMTTPAESESQQCVICGDVADGYHYSVLSCRGCNAFFRRIAPQSIQLTCKRGGNCAISKNKRCVCRACRFTKCVAAGMDRNAVQPKRDSYGSYSRCKKQSHQNSVDDSTREDDDESFDDKVKFYDEQLQRRNVMVCTTLKEALTDPKDLDKTMRPVRAPQDYELIQKVEVVQLFEWLQTLYELKDMHLIEKTKLVKSFVPKCHLLETAFYSMQRGFSDRVVLINNTFIASGSSGFEMDTDDEATRELKLKLFGQMVENCIGAIIAPMNTLMITKGEMVALKQLAFWNTGALDLAEETKKVAKEASDRTIADLHSWYQRNHFENIPERLGSLILLLSALMEHSIGFVEEIQVLRTFNMMENLAMIDNILLP